MSKNPFLTKTLHHRHGGKELRCTHWQVVEERPVAQFLTPARRTGGVRLGRWGWGWVWQVRVYETNGGQSQAPIDRMDRQHDIPWVGRSLLKRGILWLSEPVWDSQQANLVPHLLRRHVHSEVKGSNSEINKWWRINMNTYDNMIRNKKALRVDSTGMNWDQSHRNRETMR